MRSILLLTLVVCLSQALSVRRQYGYPNPSFPTAHVKNGTLQGAYSEQYDQDFFLGIPFAQPPVGNLRFQTPQSLNESWHESKLATAYAASCIGYGTDQLGYEVSEDCLYLNVVRPSGYDHKKLPVAFWIHGGGFVQGGGGDRRYNLSRIVENSVKISKPIVAVSINYRLSGWGFLNSNTIMGRGLTNLGLKDQRIALHWVQENIEAFGGDPKKVTIWGESAGAASVGFQLTAFGGRDDSLFRAAIMQSGGPIHYGPMNGSDFYEPLFNRVATAAGCSNTVDDLQCLREVPTELLNNILNNTEIDRWQPTVDGNFLPKYGSVHLAAGEFVKVPIIAGANSDEGASFGVQGINTTEEFRASLNGRPNSRQYVASLPSPLPDQLVAAYPDDLSVNVIANLGPNRPTAYPWGLQWRRAASYFGDYIFIEPRRETCSTWAAANVPAYCYRFNAIPAGIAPELGVPHFQEVALVFDNIHGLGYDPPISSNPFEGQPESYFQLAKQISYSWISFVADLDPNSWEGRGDLELWPRYEIESPKDFVWDANVTSFAEDDTYRSEGMEIIRRNNAGVYMR